MSNSYSQFSEQIAELTPEMAEWIETVLGLDALEGDDLEKLVKELGIVDKEVDLDMWPNFNWKLEGAQKCSLWLYCDEGLTEDHLILFVQALIRKFMPDYVFSATGSCTESKPLLGAFGGWWLVISKDDVKGGNTWDAAQAAVKELQSVSAGQ